MKNRKNLDVKKTMKITSAVLLLTAIYFLKDGYIGAFLILSTLIYFAGSAIVTAENCRKIEVNIYTKIVERKENDLDKKYIEAEIVAENRGWIPCLCSLVELEIENLLLGEKLNIKENIYAGAKKSGKAQVLVCEEFCGAIEVRLKKIEFTDFLKILKKSRSENKLKTVYIEPEYENIHLSQDDIWAYNMESFSFSDSKKASDASETVGISEYKAGDNIKAIHWKLSGKTGKIQVRELGFPIESKVFVLVDKVEGSTENSSLSNKRKNDLTRLATSISQNLMNLNVEHEIGWYDCKVDHFESLLVRNDADFQNMVLKLLRTPFYTGESGPIKFISSEQRKNTSSIILVSNFEKDVERLMEYGEVTIYGTEQGQ